MKKTLVALAAVAATSAFAQSSVTIYGLMDINYGTTKTSSANGDNTRKTTGLGEGTTAGNRLGFRGTEDLGGGMKAGFVTEIGLSLITGDILGNRAGNSAHFDFNYANAASGNALTSNSAFRSNDQNRQSFVSLSGGFGEVRVGYQYTNLYTVSSLSGYLGGYEGAAGADIAHTFGAGAVGGARANGLTYITPNFAGGFNAVIQYGAAGGNPASKGSTAAGAGAGTAADTYKAERTGLLLNYANGPLKASVAYTTMKRDDFGGAASAGTGKLTQIGASYNFGVASVNGTYNNGKDGLTANTDYKSHQIGVSVPFGAARLFATVGQAEQQTGAATKVEYKQQQFGAEYALSKRTMVYAVTGTDKNRTAGLSVSAYNKGTTSRFGVRHTF